MEQSDAYSQEAIRAATVAQEAIEKARQSQLNESIAEGLDKYFNRGVQEKKFVDVNRIPFICDDIRGIHAKMDSMGNDFVLIKRLVIGIVSGIGTIVIGVAIKAFSK